MNDFLFPLSSLHRRLGFGFACAAFLALPLLSACTGEEGSGSGAGGSASSSSSSSGSSSSGAAGGSSSSSSGGSGGSGTGGSMAMPCQPIPGASYTSSPTVGETTKTPPELHGDLNIKLRGWEPATGVLGFVDYGGDTDTLAPKLNTLYTDDHIPAFVQNFAVHNWDWNTNTPGGPITDWEVTMIAMASNPGEILELPKSGYDIGGGKQARVLFADDNSLTLKYTGEDNVVYGYTIHLVDICVEPALKALYDKNHAEGRNELPALFADQPLGRARSGSVMVTIRDTGAFMDPRSKKDWWP